ncbi:MAG: AraC family ligand binding domain-containing protein, partial [Candidatus Flemingiibacterium sp.]
MRLEIRIFNGIHLIYEDSYNLKTTKDHYPHTHDFCELYFHVAGKCTYMVENGIYPTDYGTCVITRNNELHSVRIEEDCQYERFYYYIKDGALPFLGSGAHMRCFFDRDFGQNNVIVLPRELMDECLSRAKETVSVYESGEPDAESVGLSNFLLTMHSINRFYNQALSLSEDKRYDSLVTNALRYINQNLTSIGKVDEIAA